MTRNTALGLALMVSGMAHGEESGLPKEMKAVGFYDHLPITDEKALLDVTLEIPKAVGRDLLVEVKAIAVNPIDYKTRSKHVGLIPNRMIVKIHAQKGKGEVVRRAIEELVGPSRAEEGCVHYEMLLDAENPEIFIMKETWANDTVLEEHKKTAHFQKFLADTKGSLGEIVVKNLPYVGGWDASGVVVDVGSGVKHYEVGDKVYYAGDITRIGTNSEYHLIDERIVGKKPDSLSFTEAAALPLTTITAYEALFDRLGISKTGEDKGKKILIIGGAGGVGSIATQLATKVGKLEVIASASRDESRAWVKELGAKVVVNHRNPLDEELLAQGIKTVDYILVLNRLEQHWPAIVKSIKPGGHIACIVNPKKGSVIELDMLKPKSATFAWEFMFTRSLYETDDMIEQQNLLNHVGSLIDAGEVRTTVNTVLSPINAENVRKAHATLEGGHALGKIVIENW
ncbi:MAG: zinc-binding alcohol dehydrogenase family protein [Akkermansiaceae bacterium]